MLYNTKLKRLSSDKHYNLLDLFVSYEENGGGGYSQNLLRRKNCGRGALT
jgi:hypothetical protein